MIKEFLFKHDLPVKKCAADLGISPSYLYQLLRKERKPSLALALKIEQYTKGEVTVADLMGEKAQDQNHVVAEFHQNVAQRAIDEKLAPIEKTLKCLDERIRKLERDIEESRQSSIY